VSASHKLVPRRRALCTAIGWPDTGTRLPGSRRRRAIVGDRDDTRCGSVSVQAGRCPAPAARWLPCWRAAQANVVGVLEGQPRTMVSAALRSCGNWSSSRASFDAFAAFAWIALDNGCYRRSPGAEILCHAYFAFASRYCGCDLNKMTAGPTSISSSGECRRAALTTLRVKLSPPIGQRADLVPQ
jgi:hypothetical protein